MFKFQHGTKCFRISNFDVTRLRHTYVAMSKDGLNHLVLHAYPMQVCRESPTKSMPSRRFRAHSRARFSKCRSSGFSRAFPDRRPSPTVPFGTRKQSTASRNLPQRWQEQAPEWQTPMRLSHHSDVRVNHGMSLGEVDPRCHRRTRTRPARVVRSASRYSEAVRNTKDRIFSAE